MKPADSGLSKPGWPAGLSKPVQEDPDLPMAPTMPQGTEDPGAPDQAMEDNPYLRRDL
jgi:hypothetical protein